jgi:hypothetical protein
VSGQVTREGSGTHHHAGGPQPLLSDDRNGVDEVDRALLLDQLAGKDEQAIDSGPHLPPDCLRGAIVARPFGRRREAPVVDEMRSEEQPMRRHAVVLEVLPIRLADIEMSGHLSEHPPIWQVFGQRHHGRPGTLRSLRG